REHARNTAVLRYGFQFRKTDVIERMFRDPIDAVVARTKSQVEDLQEPLSAVIQGVDDAWEVCLLKFTIDMIERSSGGNIGDFRKRGLISDRARWQQLRRLPERPSQSSLHQLLRSVSRSRRRSAFRLIHRFIPRTPLTSTGLISPC